MKYEAIIYEKGQGIATLTFNRPHTMNAANAELYAETRAAVEEANRDDEVRVLIVTGAGRGFNSGDDVKQTFLAEGGLHQQQRWTDMRIADLKGTTKPNHPINIDQFVINIDKPSIAAVNGPAVGAGLQIALSCDIRIASESAKFGYFFVLRNLAGGSSSMLLLPRIIGLSKAMEMMLSGELIDAAEADRIGLVSSVVPQGQLMDKAKELAYKLMKGAPLAQRAIKRCVLRAMYDPYGFPGYRDMMMNGLWQTEDHLEGARAFIDKREPNYKGR